MAGLGGLIASVLDFYQLLLIIYVLMSWFAGSIRGGIVDDAYRVLGQLCEPYLGLFRRILPTAMVGGAGIDFSPLIAIFVLQAVRTLVLRAV
ncbi:MAG: YggT family protein [Coriobacteriia bacterium]|nr:YggT family protein [Coriobacteriia bacterium]